MHSSSASSSRLKLLSPGAGPARRHGGPAPTMNIHFTPAESRLYLMGALLAAALLAPCHAVAALTDEIQVYTDDINKPGAFGLELHVNATPDGTNQQQFPGEVTTQHGLRVTPEFSYGLTHDFEAGLYLPAAFDPDGQGSLAGFKLRLKWLPLQANEESGGAFLGANIEVSDVAPRFLGARFNSELRLIGGYRNEDWLAAVNPTYDWALSAGSPQPSPQFNLGYKLARTVTEGIALGAEYYNDKGLWLHFDPANEQGKTVYATIDVDRKPWVFNFGVGRGLNSATDHWTVKAIFELPF